MPTRRRKFVVEIDIPDGVSNRGACMIIDNSLSKYVWFTNVKSRVYLDGSRPKLVNNKGNGVTDAKAHDHLRDSSPDNGQERIPGNEEPIRPLGRDQGVSRGPENINGEDNHQHRVELA